MRNSERLYIQVSAHGNNVQARIPLKKIYRFVWACPVCGGRFEQYTKFVTGVVCPTCAHRFERLAYATTPELSSWHAGKPLGILLPSAP